MKLQRPIETALRMYAAARASDDVDTPEHKRADIQAETLAAAEDVTALTALHRENIVVDADVRLYLRRWADAARPRVRRAWATLVAEAMLDEYGPQLGLGLSARR